MGKSFLVLASLALGGVALARPQVIEPVQSFPHEPDQEYTDIALSGDWAIAMSIRPQSPGGSDLNEARLFKRDATGKWTPRGELFHTVSGGFRMLDVALDGPVAALMFPESLQIFVRNGDEWDHQPIDPAVPEGYQVAVSGGTILASEDRCSFSGLIVTRVDPDRWAGSVDGRLPGTDVNCAGGSYPPDFSLDISGDRAIVWNGDALYGPPPYEARIFERNGSLWPQVATLPVPSNEAFPVRFGPRVAIRGSLALVSGSTGGTHVYRRNSSGVWKHTGLIPNYDGYPWTMHSFALDISGDKVYSVSPAIHRGVDVTHVHQERSDGSFEEVAMLAAPGQFYMSDVAADGNRVAGIAGGNLYFYELPASFPASPPVVQEDLQSGAPTGWTILDSSRFTLAQDGITQVWRQNSTTATSGAIHEADWIDQNIAADVRPLSFQGPDRWVGLVTRYQDEANYYYITLRDRDRLQIKRMLNGEFTTLADKPLLVTPGVLYRVQFESSGSLHNVYVNGVKALSVYDDKLKHGHPGIRMHMARADYDNIVIGPGARRSLFQADFETEHIAQLTRRGGDWSIFNDLGNMRLQQSQVSGSARATVGAVTADQVLQASMRLTSWAGGVPWAGLMARYTDTGNYYYVKVASNGVISLRKLIDGKVFVLKSSATRVNAQEWSTMRLEVVGSKLRVFRNNQLILEATDSSHASGTSGLMTHDAAAAFDDYLAYQP